VKNLNELQKLTDKQLQRYFGREASYLDRLPGGGPTYTIRVGPVALFDRDTFGLRLKFFAAVRGEQPAPVRA
jgi:hypothetical protein